MVNLNECKAGDKLVSKHGTILTYLKKSGHLIYPHVVEYPNGGTGNRTNDGQTFRNSKMEGDEDIVYILPSPKKPQKSFRWKQSAFDVFDSIMPDMDTKEAGQYICDFIEKHVSQKTFTQWLKKAAKGRADANGES